jgi:hypothetical protein
MIAPLDKVEALISSGVVIDGKTILGLYALKSRIAEGLIRCEAHDSLDLDQFISL